MSKVLKEIQFLFFNSVRDGIVSGHRHIFYAGDGEGLSWDWSIEGDANGIEPVRIDNRHFKYNIYGQCCVKYMFYTRDTDGGPSITPWSEEIQCQISKFGIVDIPILLLDEYFSKRYDEHYIDAIILYPKNYIGDLFNRLPIFANCVNERLGVTFRLEDRERLEGIAFRIQPTTMPSEQLLRRVRDRLWRSYEAYQAQYRTQAFENDIYLKRKALLSGRPQHTRKEAALVLLRGILDEITIAIKDLQSVEQNNGIIADAKFSDRMSHIHFKAEFAFFEHLKYYKDLEVDWVCASDFMIRAGLLEDILVILKNDQITIEQSINSMLDKPIANYNRQRVELRQNITNIYGSHSNIHAVLQADNGRSYMTGDIFESKNFGTAGVMGKNEGIVQQNVGTADLEKLSSQLKPFYAAMLGASVIDETLSDPAGKINDAISAADKKDEGGVKSALKASGSAALNFAKKAGSKLAVDVVVKWLEDQINPPDLNI